MTLTDQAAAEVAERKGGRLKTVARAKVYTVEPATGRWCMPPEVYFQEPSPTCSECGLGALWAGRPRRVSGLWLYPVKCGCGFGVIESPFRLVMGGDYEWWRTGAGGVSIQWYRGRVDHLFLDDYRTERWAAELRAAAPA